MALESLNSNYRRNIFLTKINLSPSPSAIITQALTTPKAILKQSWLKALLSANKKDRLGEKSRREEVMQSSLLSHSLCQLQEPFLTSDAETGVRSPGLYPRLPGTSWVTQGRSQPLFAFLFFSDKQSLNKIYSVVCVGFFKYKTKIQVPRNGIFLKNFWNYIYFITNPKSNVKTSLADSLVYSSPLGTLSTSSWSTC